MRKKFLRLSLIKTFHKLNFEDHYVHYLGCFKCNGVTSCNGLQVSSMVCVLGHQSMEAGLSFMNYLYNDISTIMYSYIQHMEKETHDTNWLATQLIM